MVESMEKDKQGMDCGIPDACERIVPTWLIVVDNAPTVLMFLLGAALIWNIQPVFSIPFLIYCGLSIILFWRLICPYCHHFITAGCPCGYGKIASRFFKKRTGKEFKRVFRHNIVILFPCWFIPLGVGIYLMVTKFSWALFFLFLSFCLIGFILIPAISKFVGCKSCTIKNDCPWMS